MPPAAHPPLDVSDLRVVPGAPADLAGRDTATRLGMAGKAEGRARLRPLLEEMGELQERLWAEDRRSVLLLLQGMDTAGKDGTIRRVFEGVNPQGVRVASFKKPSDNELDRDYLWRVHQAVPRRGEIGIFNRSHYEDVGVVRVLGIAPEYVWRPRYHHLREFERLLTDEGTTIVKVWLHLSKDEQKERLQARLDEPAKRWKFSSGDLAMRERWDDFAAAYDEAITETSTDHAPWYVVPADRKWVRDVAVATLLTDALRGLDPQPPAGEDGLDDVVIT